MRKTLILDEDDLILVVGKDVVNKVDENRGEMNRSEFVSFLIQAQLNKYYKNQSYIDKEEFYHAINEMRDLLRDFVDYVLSLRLAKQFQDNIFEEWYQRLQALTNSGSNCESS